VSGPWKRRYRPTVTEQDQIEWILRIVFLGGPLAILTALTAKAIW